MIKSASLAKEIVVNIKNAVGILADISRLLADHGINIEAVHGCALGEDATITILTSDNLRAIEVLKKERYANAEEKNVVVVELENKTGALKAVTARLADEDIDIKYTYGTVCPGGCPAKLVIATDNTEKTLLTLKK